MEAPPALEKREFGFIPFRKEKGMLRHKGFKSLQELSSFLASFTPSDAYYSSAYYENPSFEDMAGKGWLGADLIFDIDSDHLPTPCKNVHDKWKCLSCGFEGVGIEPESCPRCGGKKIEAEKWVCNLCLEAAKRETLKLLSFLEEDFGFPPSRIEVVFSGHRGYHLHVSDSRVLKLGSEERKEIVDYVSASGLNISILLPELGKVEFFQVDFTAEGWRGRLVKAAYSLLHKRKEELEELGVPERLIKTIEEQRENLLRELDEGRLPKASRKFWENLFREAVKLEAAAVDTVVTTDTHRLIRLPGSLHGKTGLKVVKVSHERLPDFDPFTDAVAFPEEEKIKVFIVKSKPVRFKGVEYRFKAGELVEVPLPPALFLLGLKVARLPKQAGG